MGKEELRGSPPARRLCIETDHFPSLVMIPEEHDRTRNASRAEKEIIGQGGRGGLDPVGPDAEIRQNLQQILQPLFGNRKEEKTDFVSLLPGGKKIVIDVAAAKRQVPLDLVLDDLGEILLSRLG